jgi:protein phosphatase
MGRPYSDGFCQNFSPEILERIRAKLAATGFWDDLKTDWVVLDCEILPWSAKAEPTIIDAFAPLGFTAVGGLTAAISALSKTLAGDYLEDESRLELNRTIERQKRRLIDARGYIETLRRYGGHTATSADILVAPFQILAVEGRVLGEPSHLKQMELIGKYLVGEPLIQKTDYLVVDLQDKVSCAKGEEFWLQLVEAGDEGMVVKPIGVSAEYCIKKQIQPALKCRGKEYLRIIYGPEYTEPENLQVLKNRKLKVKRNMALNEYVLGLEALERFVNGSSADRVHECVFGILALETEPTDPRL